MTPVLGGFWKERSQWHSLNFGVNQSEFFLSVQIDEDRGQKKSVTTWTGWSSPRVHIDEKVWHLDVGSSHPGAVVGPKGWAVRPWKWYVSWVQNVNNTAFISRNTWYSIGLIRWSSLWSAGWARVYPPPSQRTAIADNTEGNRSTM